MNLYRVDWSQESGGAWVPEDPCVSSGGYYAGVNGGVLVPARTVKAAREYHNIAWPQRKIHRVVLVAKDIEL